MDNWGSSAPTSYVTPKPTLIEEAKFPEPTPAPVTDELTDSPTKSHVTSEPTEYPTPSPVELIVPEVSVCIIIYRIAKRANILISFCA